jgi:hypothetical protein
MTTTPVDAVLADVQRQLAALRDGSDLRSEHERETYWHTFNTLDRRRMTIRDTVPEIAKLDPQIAAVTVWIDHLQAWRKEFVDRLATLPHTGKQEQEQERSALTLAVDNIDNGCAYAYGVAMVAGPLREKIEAHYTPTWSMQTLDRWAVGHGCLGHAQALLAELQRKRDALQSQLDAALQEPVTA